MDEDVTTKELLRDVRDVLNHQSDILADLSERGLDGWNAQRHLVELEVLLKRSQKLALRLLEAL